MATKKTKKTVQDFLKRQREDDPWYSETQKNCLHDNCTECNGTGMKKNGGICIHFISCPCSKCTPTY